MESSRQQIVGLDVSEARQDRPAPVGSREANIMASGGSPSWLTSPRVGQKGICPPQPLVSRLRPAATELATPPVDVGRPASVGACSQLRRCRY